MSSIRAVWPKQIAIPRQVGKDSYHTSAGRPVCAVGYAYQEFGPARTIKYLYISW